MPNIVVVDTGPCVALFDRDDAYHERAVAFIQRTQARLISTLAVVTEAMHVLRFDAVAQQDFLTWLGAGAIALVQPEPEDIRRVRELMAKYADLPMDFADALLVAVCERLNVRQIATLDDDFTIYRFRGRGRFDNLFLADSG